MKKLLLIVDPQIDFITGTLPVAGAAEAMDALATYVKEQGNEYTGLLQQIGILIIIVRLLMRVECGHAIVYNILLGQLFGNHYWLLLMSQRVALPYYIRVIA